MLINFHFLVPESFHTNLVQNGSVVSEKIRFEFLYVHDLGPRYRQYSQTFIKSFSCLYLPTFRSSFEQTMMGWIPRCYIPSFLKIGPPVLEKKIFEGFLPYKGVAAILVM